VSFGPGLTILVGPNGAGKTTVLEAIELVLSGSMLRQGTVRDLITRGEDFLRVEVELSEAGNTVLAVAAQSRSGERRLTADGARIDDVSRWQNLLPTRTFLPDDLRLIKGSPRRRREYMDGLAGLCDPAYPGVLRRYEEALGQRNTLLRTMRGGDQDRQFGPWESMLATTGLEISGRREAALASFVSVFQQVHAALTGESGEAVRLVYRTNVAGLGEADYRVRLAQSREADRQRTYTHLGPHRDDLRLSCRDLDIRECASQGEQRAALLALVLAEWEHSCGLESSWRQRPLLLLDDVMSELDEERRRALVSLLDRGGQVVITTTELRYFSADELTGAVVVQLPGE
jgi:DNA replication and repair protein RecF